jgi:arylsulfatase A-like enzyme
MTKTKTFLITAALSFFLVSSCVKVSQEKSGITNPNILLILVDDMGFSDIGAFGSEIATPNIDRLARSGMRFSNFHAAPVCTPTRGMLLTGLSNHEAGVGDMYFKRSFDNGLAVPEDVSIKAGNSAYAGYLLDQVAVLPELLQANGYRTYMTGKWDLGRALVEEHIPAARGFDRSFALLTGTANHLGEPDNSARGGVIRGDYYVYRENTNVVRQLPEDFFSSEYYADKMLEFLEEHRAFDEPFFAYYAPTAPHWPLQVPDVENIPYTGFYDEGYEALAERRMDNAIKEGVMASSLLGIHAPVKGRAWDDLSDEEKAIAIRQMEIYASMVQDLDNQIGRIIDALEQNGEFENTLVLFISDNGASGTVQPLATYITGGWDNSLDNLGKWDSFASLSDGFASATMAGLRDLKSSPFEGGTRVAAFVSGYGVGKNNVISHAWLSVMDVMPTLLDITGIDQSSLNKKFPSIRGRSFLPLMSSELDVIHPDDETISFEFNDHRWAVSGQWKAISMAGSQTWQLYHLGVDPGEQIDLSAEYEDVLTTMTKQWTQWADDVGVIY